MHVFIEGTAAVELTVNRDGTVSDARIVQLDYKPVGRNAPIYKAGHFDGFLEMNLLPTVNTWRFAPIAEPCTDRFTFTWRLDDSASNRKPSED